MNMYRYEEHMVNTERWGMDIPNCCTISETRRKDETIMSIIKRLFGEHLMSRLTRTQNRELSFKCIDYNMHRLTNLVILMIFSTKPHER